MPASSDVVYETSLSSDGTALIGLALFPAFRPPLRTIFADDDPGYPLTHSVDETTVDDDDEAGELQQDETIISSCLLMM